MDPGRGSTVPFHFDTKGGCFICFKPAADEVESLSLTNNDGTWMGVGEGEAAEAGQKMLYSLWNICRYLEVEMDLVQILSGYQDSEQRPDLKVTLCEECGEVIMWLTKMLGRNPDEVNMREIGHCLEVIRGFLTEANDDAELVTLFDRRLAALDIFYLEAMQGLRMQIAEKCVEKAKMFQAGIEEPGRLVNCLSGEVRKRKIPNVGITTTRPIALSEPQSTSGIDQPQPGPEPGDTTSSQGEEIQVVDIEEDEDDPAQLCSNLPITIEAVPEAEEHPPRTPSQRDTDSSQITMVRSLCPPTEDNLSCGVEMASADPDPEIVTIDDTDTMTEKNIRGIQIQAPPGRPPGPKPRSTWKRRNLTNLSFQQSLKSLQPSSHLPSILRRPGPRLPPTPPPPIVMRSSFPCKLCDYKFTTMEGLKSHIKLRHMKDPRLQQMLLGISVSQKRPVAPVPVPPPRKRLVPARSNPPPDLPLQPSPCPSCTTIFTNEYWLREHHCKANRTRVFKKRRQVLEAMATPLQPDHGQGTSHHHPNMNTVDISDGSSDNNVSESDNDRDPGHVINNPEPYADDDEDEEIISEDEQMDVDNISSDPLA